MQYIDVPNVLNSIIVLISTNSGCFATWLLIGYQTDDIRSRIVKLDNTSFGELSYISGQSNKIRVKNTNYTANGAYGWVHYFGK